MRNLLAFLAAVVVTLIGVGWYLDWFNVKSSPTFDGKKSVNVEFNTSKIFNDLHRGTQKVLSVFESFRKEGDEEPAEKGAVPLVPPVPPVPPVEPR